MAMEPGLQSSMTGAKTTVTIAITVFVFGENKLNISCNLFLDSYEKLVIQNYVIYCRHF